MASQTDIYNRALQKLGVRTVISPTEDSPRASACNRSYPIARRSLLQAHNWNCAIKRVHLAADATAPIFGRGNYFPLPVDFLRLLNLDPSENSEEFDYQIEGRAIVSDLADPLPLRYVADISDVNQMDPLFINALCAMMALDMVTELTESNVKKSDLKDDFKSAIVEARRANAIQNRPAEPAADFWETVRL